VREGSAREKIEICEGWMRRMWVEVWDHWIVEVLEVDVEVGVSRGNVKAVWRECAYWM